jgi:hypothetical protein
MDVKDISWNAKRVSLTDSSGFLGFIFGIGRREHVETVVQLTGLRGVPLCYSTKTYGQPRRWLEIGRVIEQFGFWTRTRFNDGLLRAVEWDLACAESLRS